MVFHDPIDTGEIAEDFAPFTTERKFKVRNGRQMSEPENLRCRDCSARSVRECLGYSCQVVQ
jgi:hypothetical protein